MKDGWIEKFLFLDKHPFIKKIPVLVGWKLYTSWVPFSCLSLDIRSMDL